MSQDPPVSKPLGPLLVVRRAFYEARQRHFDTKLFVRQKFITRSRLPSAIIPPQIVPMHFLRLLPIVLSIASTALGEPLLDIQTVAGKSPKEVQTALGKPSSTEKTKYGPKMTYRDGEVEIVYIHGKADWITVTPTKVVPFSEAALAELGLPAFAPNFSNQHVMRWEPCGRQYLSLSVFPSEKGVFYFYLKVATP